MWHLMGNAEWTEITPIICSHIVTVCKHSIVQEKNRDKLRQLSNPFVEINRQISILEKSL